MPGRLTKLRGNVEIAKKTSIALTGGDVADIFTVTGGPILCYMLALEITTAVSANACLVHFEADPSAGAGTATPISKEAGAPDLQSAAIGDWFHIQGDSADVALKAALGTALPMMTANNGGIVIPAGGIDLGLSTSDPTTGAATAWIVYRPMDNDVSVLPSTS